MEFHSSVTAASVPPVKRLHSFLLSEAGTKSRKVKYWGATKEEAFQTAKRSHRGKSVLWIKELV